MRDLKARKIIRHSSKLNNSSQSLTRDNDEGNLPAIEGAIRISLDHSS
jgi:hypothetical protein